jgi:asparagine synthetase B (glutamine-hydrolysing)
LVVHPRAGRSQAFIQSAVETLAKLSESRGKDSSGLVFRNEAEGELRVFKGAISLGYLLKQRSVNREFERPFTGGGKTGASSTFAVMGHSRLVTNGSQLNDENNQPVVKEGIVGIHNGIIVNEDELWSRYPSMRRSYQIDTEVMLALVRLHLEATGSMACAVSRAISEIFGTVAAAYLANDRDSITVATNNGSLYFLTDWKGLFAFASERYFLSQLAGKMHLSPATHDIRQVVSGSGLTLSLDELHFQEFELSGALDGRAADPVRSAPMRIVVESLTDGRAQRELVLDPAEIARHPLARSEASLLEYNLERIRALRRCSKCLLPETFPFIEFDDSGVCSYCRHYMIRNQPKPMDGLLEFVGPYRGAGGEPDCIVPFSGGRDSTYALHVVKNVLKLNPIAFTYDWGMVTDLARRNIARVCGKLKVENILVSADIAWKRENIRKNIVAWLRRPHLGMVPLFMAGDKFFFYYCDQVKRQTGIKLNVWGINPLENTEFKVGFLGVPPDHRKKQIFALSLRRKAYLLKGVGTSVLMNPHYLNRSVFDSIGSFISRSVAPHRDYCQLYDYFRWDEAEIEDLVLNEYRWERAVDTRTTWRIGDGTAPFYNYIYCTVAGFSEHDTFRSNQIREGMLGREEALRLVEEENQPRYPSLKWYTEIVNLDFASTMKRICEIPKLYA